MQIEVDTDGGASVFGKMGSGNTRRDLGSLAGIGGAVAALARQAGRQAGG